MNKWLVLMFLSVLIGALMGCPIKKEMEYYDICRQEEIAVLDPNNGSFVSEPDYLDFDAVDGVSVSNTVDCQGIWIQRDNEIEGYKQSRTFHKHRIYKNKIYMLEKAGGSWYIGGLAQFDYVTNTFQTILKDCFCYDFEKSENGLLIFMNDSSSAHKSELKTGLYLYDPDAKSLELVFSGRCFDLFAHGSSAWFAVSDETEYSFVKIDLVNREILWTIPFSMEEAYHVFLWIPCGEDAVWIVAKDLTQKSFVISRFSSDGTNETVYRSETDMFAIGFAGNENELYVSCFSKTESDRKSNVSLIDVYHFSVSDRTMTTYLSSILFGRFFIKEDKVSLIRRQNMRGDMYW